MRSQLHIVLFLVTLARIAQSVEAADQDQDEANAYDPDPDESDNYEKEESNDENEKSLRPFDGERTSKTKDNKNKKLTLSQMSQIHGEMDADRDGKVSMAEVVAFSFKMLKKELEKHSTKHAQHILDTGDANKDGKLNWKEYATSDPSGLLQEFAVEDGLTPEDTKYKQQEVARFEAADFDSDGFLDAAELSAKMFPVVNDKMMTRMTAAVMKVRDTDGNGRISKAEAHNELNDKDFDALDTDASGDLSEKEWRRYEDKTYDTEKGLQPLYAKADLNLDKMITKEELANAHDEILQDPNLLPSFQYWSLELKEQLKIEL